MNLHLLLVSLFFMFKIFDAGAVEFYADYGRPGIERSTAENIFKVVRGEFFGLVIDTKKKYKSYKEFLEKVNIQVEDSKNNNIRPEISILADIRMKKNSSTFKISKVSDVVIPKSTFDLDGFQIPTDNRPNTTRFLVEWFIPLNTKVGKYSFEILFPKGNKNQSKKIILEVKNYSIPRRLSFHSSFGFAPWVITLKHYGKWTADIKDVYEGYLNLASEHRIDLHKFYTSFPSIKEKKGSEILNYKLDMLKRSFKSYWDGMYNGTQSRYGFKSNITDLPIAPSMMSESKYLQKLDKEISNSKDQFFVYYVDEPKTKDLPRVKKDLLKFKKSFPNANVLITTNYDSRFDDLIDWWALNVIFLKDMSDKKLSEIRKKTKKIYFYSSCNSHGCDKKLNLNLPDFVIDRPAGHIRSIGWLGFFKKLDGFLYYDTVKGYLESDQAPWKDPFLFSGNGEGNLFYPCTKKLCGTEKPLVFPSLRLKIYRDGLEDYELLRQISEKKLDGIKKLFRDMQKTPTKLYNYTKLKESLL